jgi:hypothetical protein
MKQPNTSSEKDRDPSQATPVRHPKRGAIPSPPSDIEKAPIFAPNQGPEDQEQTSLASESDASNRQD